MSRLAVYLGIAVVLAILLPASWAATPRPPKPTAPKPTEPPEIEIKGSRFALPPSDAPDLSPAPAEEKKPPVQRQPVPDEAQRQAAEQLVHEVYQKEFAAAKKAVDKGALAGTLLKLADESKDDSSARYALLTESRDLAVAAGDVALALSAADHLADLYVVDRFSEKATALGKIAGGATTAAAHAAVVNAALSLVEEAAAADNYEGAIKLARLALETAQKTSDSKLVKQITERGKELTVRQRDFGAVVVAKKTLETEPTNAEANMTFGRWTWFVKNDAEAAMSYLALSSDAGLKDAAIKDLALPKETAAQIEVADAWWNLAEQIKDEAVKNAILSRSYQWYSQAAPNMTGLNKARAEKRIADLKSVVEKTKAKPIDIAAAVKPTEPPVKPTSSVPPAVAKRAESKGTLYVCGDDDFILAVNGEVLANGKAKPVSLPLTLKVGDIIAATSTNKNYEHGFLCCWLAEDGHAAVMSCIDTWKMFVPADPTKWMEVKPSRVDLQAALGDPHYLNIPEAAGWGAEPLWGKDPAAVYVYHVVTAAELNDAVPPLPDKEKPPPAKSVTGTLHVCADDACDFAINGVPFGAARFTANTFKVAVAPGDLITAKAINMRYEHGFLLVFVSDDEKVSFATNTVNWGCYAPTDPTRWFRVRADQAHVPAVKGDMKYLKPDIAIDALGAEPLWEPKAKNLAFFYHVVTAAELKPGR